MVSVTLVFNKDTFNWTLSEEDTFKKFKNKYLFFKRFIINHNGIILSETPTSIENISIDRTESNNQIKVSSPILYKFRTPELRDFNLIPIRSST